MVTKPLPSGRVVNARPIAPDLLVVDLYGWRSTYPRSGDAHLLSPPPE
jgi:hypothetical protein